MSEVRDILQSLREEGETLNPDDPLAPELRQRWDSTYAEFQNLQKLGAEIRAALPAIRS